MFGLVLVVWSDDSVVLVLSAVLGFVRLVSLVIGITGGVAGVSSL